MATQILHISDTHLGKSQYGSEVRRKDYARSLDTVIDIAIEENVDAVLHTGDFFDSRSPSTSDISYAFASLKRLTDENIPFYGIVGNHERKWDNQWLDIFEQLDNISRLGREPKIIKDEVALYGFDSIRDAQWESMDFNLDETDKDYINIVCMHELFTELVPPTKADRSIEYVIDNMNINPDVMPLGDYHAAVDEEVNGVSTFYAGATERTSTTREDPTFRMIDIEDGKVQGKWRKVSGVREDVPRPFYPLKIELTDSSTKADIRDKIDEIQGDDINKSVVVFNIEGSNQSDISPSDVYDVMERKGVLVPYVSDKRSPEIVEFDSEGVSDPTSIDIESMVDEQIEEKEISNNVKSIEETIVRDLTVNKSNIRDIVKDEFDNNGDKE
jgi:DNA repair exonuclease SbcCD nuclease subunit